jgi:predicted sulfurtransferase
MARRAKASADFARMHLRVRREIVNLVAADEDRTVRRVAIGRSVAMVNVESGEIATAVGQDRVPMILRNGRVSTQINPFKRI